MGVSFRGSIEDKPIELPAARLAQPDGAMKARLSYLLGEDFSAAAKYVEAQGDRLAVRGFLCPPSISRSRRDRQHLIVNGRPVLDNALATMVQRSYGDTIYGHRHPQWVLYIDVPTEEVDVNVHPAKAHVRFRDERRIMGQLFRLCEDAIGKMRAGSESDARVVSKPLATLRPASSPPTKGIESPTIPEVTGKPANKDVLAFPTVEAAKQLNFASAGSQVQSAPSSDSEAQSLGRAIGQVGALGLAEHPDGLLVVDIHAAHERVLYERLKQSHQARGSDPQPLVAPASVSVSALEADAVEDRLVELQELGFELTRTGQQRFELSAVPAVLASLRGFDAAGFTRRLLQADGGDAAHVARETGFELLGEIACKTALRSGDVIDASRLDQLLREMESTPRSGYCNHGRPTWIILQQRELEAFFLRGR